MTSGSRVAFRLGAASLMAVVMLGGCEGDEKRTTTPQSKSAANTSSAPTPTPSRSTAQGTPDASPPAPRSLRPQPPGPAPSTPQPPKPLVPVITHIDTKDKVVFITIDDGWVQDPKFVRMARERHIPLTVFLTNDAAKKDYGYFRRLQDLGAPIENHTMTHPLLTKHPAKRQREEICPAQDIYAQKYGTRPTLLRPPYGAFNKTTREVAASCGIKAIVNWTAEYRSDTGRMYYQRYRRLQSGDIILWHFNPDMPGNFKKLLHIIDKQGFRPAPLTDYLPLP